MQSSSPLIKDGISYLVQIVVCQKHAHDYQKGPIVILYSFMYHRFHAWISYISCLNFLFFPVLFCSVLHVIRIAYSGSDLKFLNNQMGFGAYSLNF